MIVHGKKFLKKENRYGKNGIQLNDREIYDQQQSLSRAKEGLNQPVRKLWPEGAQGQHRGKH